MCIRDSVNTVLENIAKGTGDGFAVIFFAIIIGPHTLVLVDVVCQHKYLFTFDRPKDLKQQLIQVVGSSLFPVFVCVSRTVIDGVSL